MISINVLIRFYCLIENYSHSPAAIFYKFTATTLNEVFGVWAPVTLLNLKSKGSVGSHQPNVLQGWPSDKKIWLLLE